MSDFYKIQEVRQLSLCCHKYLQFPETAMAFIGTWTSHTVVATISATTTSSEINAADKNTQVDRYLFLSEHRGSA